MASGSRHHNWRGGKIHKGAGYTGLLLPEHPRADKQGYVLEHIVIAEKAIGHSLPAQAEIHHVNNHRRDNTNSNLVICENHRYHMLLHQREDAIKAGVPAHWLKCPYCKIYDARERLWVGPKNGKHHRTCFNKYNRDRKP